ncbi:GNAT family N-acetyltransferase [Tumebacillus sp. BK434]|uniref:GNAT family N-acetyltransferase n=1 Tax=Tumebacillus sp. BK434 TaxID=2512169 RepID=UPI00104B972A|nr:GNAT family N-acetyltransferase [Tumebacillus sp. BK434]
MTLEVRRIEEQEWETYCQIRAESYHQLYPERAVEMRHLTDLNDTRCVFVRGEMKVTGRLFDYRQYLHGQALPMGGIASIATRIEERGQGYVRTLLASILQELKADGVPVSCLHPSSYSFYRQFGYEYCCEKRIFKSPAQRPLFATPAAPDSGRIVRSSEAELDALKDIYDRYAMTRNGLLQRSDREWVKIVQNVFGGSKPRLYIWRDADDRPQGYIVLVQQEDNRLFVKELIAANIDAQKGLLSLLERDNLLKGWEWETGIDSILSSLLHDPKQMQSDTENWFMGRIVDVTAAWQVTSPLAQPGSVRLGVQDSFAPWNEGTWQVAVETAGSAIVSASSEPAQASADIGTWSQIFFGYLTVEEAQFLGKLSVHDPNALPVLNSLWASSQKPLMLDYF